MQDAHKSVSKQCGKEMRANCKQEVTTHQHWNGRSIAASQFEGPNPLTRDCTTAFCSNLIIDYPLNPICSDLGLGTSVEASKVRNHLLWTSESRSSDPNTAGGEEKQERRSCDPRRRSASTSAQRRRSPGAAAPPFADAGGPMRGPYASVICEIKQSRPFRPIEDYTFLPSFSFLFVCVFAATTTFLAIWNLWMSDWPGKTDMFFLSWGKEGQYFESFSNVHQDFLYISWKINNIESIFKVQFGPFI